MEQSKTNIDDRLEEILLAVKEGFDDTASKADINRLEKRMDGLDGRMDGLEKRMDGLDGRMDGLEQEVARMRSVMVTKSYLDEKLAGLKGDIIQKLRIMTNELEFIVSVLSRRGVLSEKDVEFIRSSFQIFPALPNVAS